MLSLKLLSLKQYWRRYKAAPRQVRIFFWTNVIFFIIMAGSTLWAYARLYYARTQISPPSEHVSLGRS